MIVWGESKNQKVMESDWFESLIEETGAVYK